MALEKFCGFDVNQPLFSKYSSFSDKEEDIYAYTANFKDNTKIMLPPSVDVSTHFTNQIIDPEWRIRTKALDSQDDSGFIFSFLNWKTWNEITWIPCMGTVFLIQNPVRMDTKGVVTSKSKWTMEPPRSVSNFVVVSSLLSILGLLVGCSLVSLDSVLGISNFEKMKNKCLNLLHSRIYRFSEC